MLKMNDIAGETAPMTKGSSAGSDPGNDLVRRGVPGLSSSEQLLAAVLGPGRPAARDVARDLLRRWGHPAGLAALHPAVLARTHGMGPARARRLLAALELGGRAFGPPARPDLRVRRPEDRPWRVARFASRSILAGCGALFAVEPARVPKPPGVRHERALVRGS